MKALTKSGSRPHEQQQPTGTQVGNKYALDVKMIDGAIIISDSFGQSVTITDNAGKISLDVNVTNITITADNDSIETRSMPMLEYVDEVSSTVQYHGMAVSGTLASAAGWRIKRVTDTATALLVEWASTDFDQVWDDRAVLTYA